VVVAKPLCCDEPGLEDNLRSFAEQDHPNFEVVFGVRDANDPAAAIARPFGTVVVEPNVIGTNLKVSNLAAMRREMHGEIIIISDSDMRVTPDYLAAVVAPFEDDRVGAVTCLYRGIPSALCPLPSDLGAMGINENFFPSALVAESMQPLTFCFGATMAVRTRVLDEIGGFDSLANLLADDYMLGKLVSDRGYRVVLSDYVVDAIVHEPSLRELFAHELRWARTIRSVRPWSYASIILTMPLFWSLFLGWPAIAIALALRTILQAVGPGRFAPWLIPLRDILTLSVYGTAHLGRSVRWRNNKFEVADGGVILRGCEEIGSSRVSRHPEQSEGSPSSGVAGDPSPSARLRMTTSSSSSQPLSQADDERSTATKQEIRSASPAPSDT